MLSRTVTPILGMVYAEHEGATILRDVCLQVVTFQDAKPLEDHDLVPFAVYHFTGQEIQFIAQRVKIPLLHDTLMKKSSRSDNYPGLKSLNARCLPTSVYSCRCSYTTVGRT